MISDDEKRGIRELTSALVATMRGYDFDDEAIRQLSAKAAAETVARGIHDAWDQEAYAEVFRLAFEQAIKDAPKS
jgi:hypothetical protein